MKTTSSSIGAGAALVASSSRGLAGQLERELRVGEPHVLPDSHARDRNQGILTERKSLWVAEEGTSPRAAGRLLPGAATVAHGSGQRGVEEDRGPMKATATRMVGRGAFASVRVETAADGTHQAIKIYAPRVDAPGSERQRMHERHLENEIRLVGKLDHAHIIAPQSVRRVGGATELLMEYAPNGSLEEYAKARGVRGVADADGQPLFRQLCEAVAYLHGRRVVHRDIKLENIVLDARMRARLIDFGTAQELGKGESLAIIQGSPGYMAPEVLRAATARTGDYDAMAADMWSVGVALYCLFNEAELPFLGKDIHELVRNVQNQQTPFLPHMSRPASNLLLKLLSKSAPQRPTAHIALRHEWLTSAPQPAASPHSKPASPPQGGRVAKPQYAPWGGGAASGAASPRRAPESAQFCASMSCHSSLGL
jgi:serine/threonine protein kinase